MALSYTGGDTTRGGGYVGRDAGVCYQVSSQGAERVGGKEKIDDEKKITQE